MRKTLTILFAAATLASTPGCWFFSYWDDDDVSVDEPTWRDPSSRSVTFDRLDADLGGHQVALSSVAGTASGGWGTTLEVDTTEGGSWSLFRLTVGADLYARDLPENVVYVSNVDSVDLMGCTGDAPYEFDYDGYARDVEVQVTPGVDANSRNVDFTATFDDGFGEQVVTGRVVLDLSDSPSDTTVPGSTGGGDVAWEEISADVGDQGPYALNTVSGSGYTDGYYSSVEFETTEPGQWVLFRLSSYNTDIYSAEPGDVIEDAELMGCTGDAPGNFDYDGYADDVQVQILPGATPSERIGRLTGSFTTQWGTQSIDATFRYEVR